MTSPSAPASTFTDLLNSRSPSPEDLPVDPQDGESTTAALDQEPATRRSSAEPAENDSFSSFSDVFSNDTTSYTPSQYRPALKRKASQDLSCFAEEQARSAGLDEPTILEISSQFAHVSSSDAFFQFSQMLHQYSMDQKLIVLRVAQKRQAVEFGRVIKAAQGPPAISSTLQVGPLSIWLTSCSVTLYRTKSRRLLS